MRRTRWSKEGPFKREDIIRKGGSRCLLAGTDVSFRSFPCWEEGFDTERICCALAEDLLCPCCSQRWLLLCGVILWQVPRALVPLGELEGRGKRSRQLLAREHPCATSPPRPGGKQSHRGHICALGLRLSFAPWLQGR